jgi:ubiquinone/menaquinone biosynthesis C-methylase UbiE
MSDHTMVDSMRAYYARRAAEYERVYAKPERQADLRAIEAWLPTQFAGREVLEIACGTGWWTVHGARDCASWLASDLNEETMALAQSKPLPAERVRFVRADAYAPHEIDGSFDAAFAGFWWSHVPLARLSSWLAALHAKLQPGSRVVFIDNLFVEGSSSPITRTDAQGNTYQQRRLDDGSAHEVLKNFPTREQAMVVLGPRATNPQWHQWPHYWALIYEVH